MVWFAGVLLKPLLTRDIKCKVGNMNGNNRRILQLAEEKRIKRFMEARGGSVGKGYIRVNGKWVKKKEIENVK